MQINMDMICDKIFIHLPGNPRFEKLGIHSVVWGLVFLGAVSAIATYDSPGEYLISRDGRLIGGFVAAYLSMSILYWEMKATFAGDKK